MDDTQRELTKAAYDLMLLRSKVERGVRNLVDAVEPMAAVDFWAMMATYYKLVDRAMYRMPFYNAVENAADELFRAPIVDASKSSRRPWGRVEDSRAESESRFAVWLNCARFVRAYRFLTAALGKSLRNIPGIDRGDDGYGDLMDSLPMAGQEVCDFLTGKTGKLYHYEQAEAMLKDHKWQKYINGENYIQMRLTEKLTDKLEICARDLYAPPIED